MKKAIFFEHIKTAAEQTGRTVEDILAEVRGMGYEGLECSADHFEGRREEFRELLAKSGFVISSVYRFFDFGHRTDSEEIGRYLDDLAYLGAEKTLIVPGFFTAESDRKAEFEEMIRALRLVCEMAAERGITVTLEDFDDVNSPCRNIAGLRRFMDEVPGLRFTLDTGNFRYSCEDVLEGYEALKDRLGHVHLKDRSENPLTEGDSGPKALDGKILYPAPAGEGYIPIRECIERTKADGYDSWYAAEHFNCADTLAYIRRSADFLAHV
ncbi:MAG: sugar phosphate isomerase/epimerase [Oscillospiraceae bacterium]|nr:sugar phosphate isomerase/epimerase [Oscillospiraceae bacterium]